MFELKRPCADCPFRRVGGIRVRPGRVAELLEGFFPCHKTATLDDEDRMVPTGKEQFCAGRLILGIKEEDFNHMMRIGERTGWDPTTMQDVEAVFDSVGEMVEAQSPPKRRKGRTPRR